MAREILTAQYLRETLSYDQDSGIFRWLEGRASSAAGSVAGGLTKNGYMRIGINGRCYLAHRLAWFYCHGVWPKEQVDHLNGKRTDNRIENLRESSQSGNMQNKRRAQRNNVAGFLGVSRNGSGFQARIGAEGGKRWLGTFRTPDEAYAAYVQAKRRLHQAGTL
jgi:hypothetical protein